MTTSLSMTPPIYASAVSGPAELTEAQRRFLSGNGFVLVPSVLGADSVDSLSRVFNDLVRSMWDAWSPDSQWEEAGVVSVRLDVADPRFEELVGHPLLLSAAESVIGRDCDVNDLRLRAPIPGYGHQGLHPDYTPEQGTCGPWQVLAGMWCISEFTQDNGPLRVVPGSHRSSRDPIDDMEWVGMGPHPHEVKLLGPAGSLILFDSARLWHSGTFNYGPDPRLAVTTYLGRADSHGSGPSDG